MENEAIAVNFGRVHEARGFQVRGEFKTGGVGHKRIPGELGLALIGLVGIVDRLVLRDADGGVPVGRRVVQPVEVGEYMERNGFRSGMYMVKMTQGQRTESRKVTVD